MQSESLQDNCRNVIKIVLDEDDFRCLITGGVVYVPPKDGGIAVQIALSDIGYDRMVAIVKRAIEGPA